MKKGIKIAVIAVSSLALACVAGLAVTGWQIGWGPFAGLYDWETREVTPVAAKYPAAERQHEGRLFVAGRLHPAPAGEFDPGIRAGASAQNGGLKDEGYSVENGIPV